MLLFVPDVGRTENWERFDCMLEEGPESMSFSNFRRQTAVFPMLSKNGSCRTCIFGCPLDQASLPRTLAVANPEGVVTIGL
jgi:hypothetical protein